MTDELRIARLIAAPVDRVFAAFTEPGGQKAMYGRDEPGWVVRSDCDLRVGGAWTIDFGPTPDRLYRHRHVFTSIEPPHRVALATTETRLDGSSLAFETEFLFEDENGRTRMTMTQRGFPSAELREEHGRGVPVALARFERALKGDAMGATVLDMSMSLDGFVTGPDPGPDNGLGDGGERLHEWFFGGEPTGADGIPGRPADANGAVMDEARATGAVVAGRKTFEHAGGWGGDHHDGVPIYVISRSEPMPEAAGWPLVTYLDDVEAAMTAAKRAAGGKDVMFHGVVTARLALEAGLLDELEIHLVPILLGGGTRLFGEGGPAGVELERVRVIDGPGVTHLRYRVLPDEPR
jgi:dihydrofolate reductase/uncharacterized protein YndB with AHSA1/START domain